MELAREIFEVKAPGAPQTGYLLTAEVGARTREQIYGTFTQLQPNTVLELDFSSIKYMDASASTEILVKMLRRLESGECRNRFFILSHVKGHVLGEMRYALKLGQRAVIVLQDEGWYIVGSMFPGDKSVLTAVVEMGSVRARELQEALGYKTVNEASTRLSSLYSRCLLAREPIDGRKFRYFSLLQGYGHVAAAKPRRR